MEQIKKRLRRFYVPVINYINKTKRRRQLITDYIADYKLYKKHSITFKRTDIKNKEADIILQYHSLEKGMLFKDMKKGFAKYRIENLHKLLSDKEVVANVQRCQIRVGYQIMCKYYELHQELGYDIEDIYTKKQYDFYKSVLASHIDPNFNGVVEWDKKNFYKLNNQDFQQFAHSRKSTRDFTGEKFSHELLENVIKLANTAPSVCNRQASNVYLIEDKTKIDEVLRIQNGFTGYTKNVSQLLILTNDRKYYYTVGERNQLFIDGGAYLMNLLYALHYYKIGNCPANWGKTIEEEAELSKVITIPESEKIICIIPIGNLPQQFRTTLSRRRDIAENFFKL